MFFLYIIIVGLSSCCCTSAAKTTDAPVTVTSAKLPVQTTTAATQSKPEIASNNTSSTSSTSSGDSRSQKEILGLFGTWGLGNKKAAEVAPAETAPSQKTLLGSFGSLFEKTTGPKQDAPIPEIKSVTDKTKTKTKTQPKSDTQSCDVTDMCLTMNGICNNGKCVHVVKDCVADIKCECEAGFQGQFCSVPVVTTPDVSAGVKTSSTPSTTTDTMSATTPVTSTPKSKSKPKKNSGKHLVNGSIDKAKLISDYTSTGKLIGHDLIHETSKGKYLQDTHKGSNTQLEKGLDSIKHSNDNGNGNHDMVTKGQNSGNGEHAKVGDNGNGHGNTNINDQKHDTNGNGNYDNGKKSNGNNDNGNTRNKPLAEPVSKDGSYRKGPEATLTANNNPISFETTKAKTHKIKRGHVSVIDHVTDTVTLATLTVKKTFIGAIKQQSERVNDINTKSKNKKGTKSKKQKEEKTIVKKLKPSNEINKVQTTDAQQANDSRHTKLVIIDSSNNISINVLSNVHVKTQEQIVVTETNGSVHILIKNADTNLTTVNSVVNSVDSEVPKDATIDSSSPSLADRTVESLVQDKKHGASGETLNVKRNSQKGQTLDVQLSNMVNTVSNENTKTAKSTVVDKKQTNKDNSFKQSGTPSVFSPIIKLLKDLQSPELVHTSLSSGKKGKTSHTKVKKTNTTLAQQPPVNSPTDITASQLDNTKTSKSQGERAHGQTT